jgi:hypothetical protein
MKKRWHNLVLSGKVYSQEAGEALILVLIFLLLGSLVLLPSLHLVSTALQTGRAYEDKTNELHAADAGVDDAVWRIKYNGLEALFESPNFNYIFSTNATYTIDDTVNGLTTNVTIGNVWFPTNVTLDELSLTSAQAKGIVERPITDNTTNRLVVAGTPLDEDDYRIKIEFYPAVDVTENLSVSSIGIWIPQGFSYDGDCNMETFAGTQGLYDETIEDCPGGQAIVWDFSLDPIPFPDLPPVDLDPGDFPQTAEITFSYENDDSSTRPSAIAWIVTAGTLSSDIPISWDIDTRYYSITSIADNTKVDAYASRSEMRNMYAATAGDYVAIGNSLMTDDDHDANDLRETWHSSSTTSLSSLPDDAYISQASLFWSGFFKSGFSAPFWGPETCTSTSITNNWTNSNPSTVWIWNNITDDNFRGHFTTSSHVEAARYLEMKNSTDLSTFTVGNTIIEWEHMDGGTLEGDENPAYRDRLQFQLSADNGASWSELITAFCNDVSTSMVYYYYVIPEEYMTSEFKFRFYLDGFSESGEYCYIDDIAIARITGSADTSATFTIDGYDTHSETVNALVSQLIGNKYKGQYSYACWQDVTELVRAHSDRNGEDDPIGNAEYTVGDVLAHESDAAGGPYYLAYCGWSLVIIYHSSDTAGRQLYLWTDFSYSKGDENLDFDKDGLPGGTITGFLVPERIGDEEEAAKFTCFVGEGDECYTGDSIEFNDTILNDGFSTNNVWNSLSIGMNQDGVDIDTFSIPWGVVNPDDSEAQIDFVTQTDNFNLIYLILSVRSETVVGGTRHYVISGN